MWIIQKRNPLTITKYVTTRYEISITFHSSVDSFCTHYQPVMSFRADTI